MATLIGKETSFGSNLYKDNLLSNVKDFCFIGADTIDDATVVGLLNQDDLLYSDVSNYIIYESAISYASYDVFGQASFDCLLPYSVDLNKYVHAIALINTDSDGNKEITDWSIITPFFQKSQVGGKFIYKTAVAGDSGEIIFKDTDLVTENQVRDLILEVSGSIEDLENVIALSNENKDNISTNLENINTNASNISSNLSKINTNASDIGSNLSNINTKTSNIG